MENPQTIKIPNALCQQIFNMEFQLDVGNITEEVVSKTVELYSEAISFYMKQWPMTSPLKKRVQFYQEKIKKLLSRGEVQKCLLGEQINHRSIDLQREIQKLKESAPEQAKTLLKFYKLHASEQEKKIKRVVEEQDQRLKQRIQRRSRSKSRCGKQKDSLRGSSPFRSKMLDLQKENISLNCIDDDAVTNEIRQKRKINSFKAIREKNTVIV